MILVHELGHFLFAKIFKVEINNLENYKNKILKLVRPKASYLKRQTYAKTTKKKGVKIQVKQNMKGVFFYGKVTI